MWRHPRYAELTGRPPPEAPTAPPTPTGETLATLIRRGPDGVEQRLRIALDSFEGHEYVSVRLWEAGWPTKKGCSLRMAELPMIVTALQEALGRAARSPAPEPTREAPPRRRQRPESRRQWDEHGSPPAPGGHDDDAY
jgi:hypothetical protein